MTARKLRKRKDGIVYLNEKDALWQYILDHAWILEDGQFHAHIRIKNQAAFFESLAARQQGLYRYTEQDLWDRFLAKPAANGSKQTTKRRTFRHKLKAVLYAIRDLLEL